MLLSACEVRAKLLTLFYFEYLKYELGFPKNHIYNRKQFDEIQYFEIIFGFLFDGSK